MLLFIVFFMNNPNLTLIAKKISKSTPFSLDYTINSVVLPYLMLIKYNCASTIGVRGINIHQLNMCTGAYVHHAGIILKSLCYTHLTLQFVKWRNEMFERIAH